MNVAVRDVLRTQFDIAWALADHHLATLSTEECLWRPATVGLQVQQGSDGLWRADWPEHEGYDLGPSSVGWLTWHLLFWWSMVLDHSFGAGTLTREQVYWPGTAEGVRDQVAQLRARWLAELAPLTDEQLQSGARTRWPFKDRPFADVLAWANVELTKSAAEIGYARFLFAGRTG